jgi:SNF2 family DNA or RNA helicase
MKPLPFQIEDGKFLLGLPHRGLWSEPGTGKTLATALALEAVDNSIIVAPAAATAQWVRVLQARGMDAQLATERQPATLPRHLVTSWGLMARGLLRPYLDRERFEALVLDESHKAVRDEAARTSEALRLTQRVKRVWPLTGTPMIRYADDLWPLCNALWRRHLEALGIRSKAMFIRRFCTTRDGFVVGTRQFTLRTLHEMLYGLRGQPQVVVRRTLAEVAPLLPPVTSRVYEVPLTFPERKRLDELLTPELLAALEAAQGALDEDSHIATARRALGLLKAPEAAQLVSEAPGKVIAVYWHTEVGDLLSKRLGETSQVRLDGSTPQAKRQQLVDAFNKPKGPRVFLLQMVAGGEAINPHEHCSHLIFCERDWSGATMEQALRRVRRMGQAQHQQIDFVDADHPIDIAMRRIAARKMRDLGVLTE